MAEILPIRCKRLSNQSIYHIMIVIIIRVSYATVDFYFFHDGPVDMHYELFWIKVSAVSLLLGREMRLGPPLFFLVFRFIYLCFFLFLKTKSSIYFARLFVLLDSVACHFTITNRQLHTLNISHIAQNQFHHSD